MTASPIAPVGAGSNLAEITALPGGGFMAVWLQNVNSLFPVPGASDEDALAVFGRRLAADGSPAGPVFQINTKTDGFQTDPEVAVLSNGNLVVAWTDGPGLANFEVEAKAIIIDVNGVAQTDEIQLATVTEGDQRIPTVAPTDDGGFMAVWQDARPLGGRSDNRLLAQRFDAEGERVGPEVWVRDDNGAQEDIKLLAMPDDAWALFADTAPFNVTSTSYWTETYVDWFEGIQRPEVVATSAREIQNAGQALIDLGEGRVAIAKPIGPFDVEMSIYQTAVRPDLQTDGESRTLQFADNTPDAQIRVTIRDDMVDFTPQGIHDPAVTGAVLSDGTIALAWTVVIGGTVDVPEFGVKARLFTNDGVAISDVVDISDETGVQGTELAAPFAAADAGGNLFLGWSQQTDRAIAGNIEVVGGIFDIPRMDLSGETAGDDKIVGTDAAERFTLTSGSDTVFAGGGNDTIINGGATDGFFDEVFGQAGDDLLGLRVGQHSETVFEGGSGRDTIDFSASTQAYDDQEVFGANVRDVEVVLATPLADALRLYFMPEDGLVHGYGGDDTFYLDFADVRASMDGGDGFDRLVMNFFGEDASQPSTGHTLTKVGDAYELRVISDIEGYEPGPVTLRGIEEIVFEDRTITLDPTPSQPSGALAEGGPVDSGPPTPGDDNLRGTAGPDVVNLLAGNDRYDGLGGADTINGFSGNDTIDGGAGADLLIGGQGSDVIYVDNVGDRVSESRKWAGSDTVISSVDFRMGRKHIEDLELTGDARLGAGNGLRNTITGNDGDNTLDGGKNVDTLIGGLGNDRYLIRAPGDNAVEQAGEGIDTVLAFRAYALDANIERLFLQTLRNDAGEGVAGVNGIGNALDNTIVGNPFDNVIIGREGNDTLRGQAGADTFVFDRALGPRNVDRIVDFDASEGDGLRFAQNVFQGVVKGGLADGAFAAGTAAADANDRFVFDQGSGRLWFDRDGAGGADQILVATFDGGVALTADDIVLI